jgi:hypothetical protein
MAGKMPTSSGDGDHVTTGNTSDAAWVSGAGTVISLLKKIASAGGSAVSIADGSDVTLGAKADAAATTDAGTFTLVALVKRLLGKFPAVVGQTTKAGSLSVALASDSDAFTITGSVTVSGAATATLTNVNDTATSTTLLASNASRTGFMLMNDSTSILYVKFGTTASATSFTVKLAAGDYYELVGAGCYTGRIDGIWSVDSTGAARLTELSA